MERCICREMGATGPNQYHTRCRAHDAILIDLDVAPGQYEFIHLTAEERRENVCEYGNPDCTMPESGFSMCRAHADEYAEERRAERHADEEGF